jgi:hypothetical protein
VADLGPTGNAGADGVPFIVERYLLTEILDKLRPLRTWTDEAHFAAQNVYELRQFVETVLAESTANTSDSRIVGPSPLGFTVGLGIDFHGSKFEQAEAFASTADSKLSVENRTRGIESD